MDQRDFLSELLVVIVLYRKKPEESIALSSLERVIRNCAATPAILIYDNSPLRAQCSGNHLTYRHNPQNRGTSYAYNQAALHAREESKTWMLLLDQDTQIDANFLSDLGQVAGTDSGSVAFVPRVYDSRGLLSPFRFTQGRGRRIHACPDVLPLNRYRFVNSGLLIRVTAFEAAGGYDERVPLDFSDICFGERLRSQNVTDRFRVVDASLTHAFSDNEDVPLEQALNRFRFFQKGSIAMGKYSGSTFLYAFNTFVRACRLCLRHRNLRFLILLINRNHD